MMDTLIIILVLVFLLLILGAGYLRLLVSIERRARDIHMRWRDEDLAGIRQKEILLARDNAKNLLDEWKQNEEESIRKDAIARSRAVIRGNITEHLIPFLDMFPYDPRDVRFLGTPVDLVVFDGLAEGKLREVVIAEVKSGKYARLSDRERQVQRIISEGKVRYEIFRSG